MSLILMLKQATAFLLFFNWSTNWDACWQIPKWFKPHDSPIITYFTLVAKHHTIWFSVNGAWNSLSARNVKTLIFPSDPVFHAMNFCEKVFWYGWNAIYYEFLKTWKSCFPAAHPHCWSQDWHAQSCDVDSGMRTCNFRLHPYRLFNLCKFSFIFHAKCSLLAFCMNHQHKFPEVKQARWVNPEVTCSWIYITTPYKPREDWCEWWTKMVAKLNVFKNN